MTRIAAILVVILTACGGKAPPPTRYYELAAATAAPSHGAIIVEPFQTEGAYDDERIVYRSSPYRLDYYDYHRWASAPGAMLSNYLARALHAEPEGSDDNALVIGGRVLAIEEVDTAPKHWTGRLVLELTARDPSGKVVWSKHLEENVPMPRQSPEGLAHAMTTAMQEIVGQIAPELAALADAKSHPAVGQRDKR
jgi:uncharacterized lipoprotein YmbA